MSSPRQAANTRPGPSVLLAWDLLPYSPGTFCPTR